MCPGCGGHNELLANYMRIGASGPKPVLCGRCEVGGGTGIRRMGEPARILAERMSEGRCVRCGKRKPWHMRDEETCWECRGKPRTGDLELLPHERKRMSEMLKKETWW